MSVLTILGLVVYIVGYVFGSLKVEKNQKAFQIASYVCLGVGLVAFFIGGFFWANDLYGNDDPLLAELSVAMAALLLLSLGLLLVFKKKGGIVPRLLMAFAFLSGIAFLICMISLSQTVTSNGIPTDSSSSSLL